MSQEQVTKIGAVDILLIPVGGYYTIDAKAANKIIELLKPKVVIPMHYKTAKLEFPIVGVDEFLSGKRNVKKLQSSEMEFKVETLPAVPEVIVFQSAR